MRRLTRSKTPQHTADACRTPFACFGRGSWRRAPDLPARTFDPGCHGVRARMIDLAAPMTDPEDARNRMPTTDDPVLDALSSGECRRLLASMPIGRLAFTVGALPTIQPVHFGVRDDEVLIPARRGGKVEAASHGAVVAFEVDAYDEASRTGWSVTVVGPSRVLSDPAEVTLLEGTGLTPWAPGPNGCVVVVRIARITGRRIRRAPTPAAVAALSSTCVTGPAAS